MRASTTRRLAGFLVLIATSLAHAQQPAPPQVTMGADIKLLRFDWEPVAGAAFYQLRFRPDAGSPYQPVGVRVPASVTQTEQAIPVHLQDWSGMRSAPFRQTCPRQSRSRCRATPAGSPSAACARSRNAGGFLRHSKARDCP